MRESGADKVNYAFFRSWMGNQDVNWEEVMGEDNDIDYGELDQQQLPDYSRSEEVLTEHGNYDSECES